MIVHSASEFLQAISKEHFPPTDPATARAVFLVTPHGFALAEQSARDNRYMDLSSAFDTSKALIEHANLAHKLSSMLPVVSFPGDPATPDALFPNNVFATVPGRVIIGAMQHPVRQREAARADIRQWFSDILRYQLVDLSTIPCVAELTGSLIIDRARGIGYCGLSGRCDVAGAAAMSEAFGLKLTFCFALAEEEYHTNVVMSVLAGKALVMARCGFADSEVPLAIASFYGDQVLHLDKTQKAAFAGNCIALSPETVWMSTRAANALNPEQLKQLASWGFELCSVPLDEIEKAGGSLRCCVGEIF